MLNFSRHWIIILTLCMTAILADAQKLHVFIVADDIDQNIGSGYDFNRIQCVAQEVATKSGLLLVPYYCKKSQTTSAQLVSKLTNLDCSSDDAVWFYYSGHGFNDGGTFTAFSMPDGVNRFKMETVETKIKSKNPRLAIIMYDACNIIWGNSSGVVAGRAGICNINLNITEANCQKLFRNSSGVIKVASNTAGERKVSYGNNSTGGFFTSAFVASLNEADGDWNRLLSNTKNQTQAKAKEFNREQIPYYVLNLNQNPSIISPPISNTPDEPSGSDF